MFAPYRVTTQLKIARKVVAAFVFDGDAEVGIPEVGVEHPMQRGDRTVYDGLIEARVNEGQPDETLRRGIDGSAQQIYCTVTCRRSEGVAMTGTSDREFTRGAERRRPRTAAVGKSLAGQQVVSGRDELREGHDDGYLAPHVGGGGEGQSAVFSPSQTA